MSPAYDSGSFHSHFESPVQIRSGEQHLSVFPPVGLLVHAVAAAALEKCQLNYTNLTVKCVFIGFVSVFIGFVSLEERNVHLTLQL